MFSSWMRPKTATDPCEDDLVEIVVISDFRWRNETKQVGLPVSENNVDMPHVEIMPKPVLWIPPPDALLAMPAECMPELRQFVESTPVTPICIEATRLSFASRFGRWIAQRRRKKPKSTLKNQKCGQHVNKRKYAIRSGEMQIGLCRTLNEMSWFVAKSRKWARGREAKKKFWPEWMPGEGIPVMIQGNE